MAKALANECKANFFSIIGPELLNMWFDNSEANVRDVFEKAHGAAPCVLCFDGLDSIVQQRCGNNGDRGGAINCVMNQFLMEMDRIGAKKNVFIIGATNWSDIIDMALMRPGKLDQFIYIPMLYYDSRLSILRTTLRKSIIPRDVDHSYLAVQTDKFTGADLTEIYQSAFKIAIREEIERDMGERIKEENANDGDTMEGNDDNVDDSMPEIISRHFEPAVRNARKSVSDRDLAQYASFTQTLQYSRAAVTGSGGVILVSFPFPVQANSGDGTAGGAGASVEEEEEEKDMYS